jgi:4-diphosphocytidyl-2-C-methyl-D-erythritol kinase
VSTLRAQAPGKVNLCLWLGEGRGDGRHELVTLVQAVSLVDEVALEPGDAADEVLCPDVEGENLAARALRAYREASGWDGRPCRLRITKRIPVAAGMGGGSSDAAAALRLAAHAAGRPDDAAIDRVAPALGSDVPALLRPGLALAGGAGERVVRLEPLEPFGVLVVPGREPLSTAEVYREADRLGLPRPAGELAELRRALETALRPGGRLPLELVHNDLEPAARALRPAIDDALAAALESGADRALVSGSGPTVAGLFAGADGPARARAAAERVPGAIAAEPVGPEAGRVRAA